MRLTGRGVGLVGAGPLLFAAGYWFGYPELAVLGGGCLMAVLCGAAFVAWRPRLTVGRAVDPDRVARGEASSVTVSIANAGRLFGATLIARDRLGGSGSIAVPLIGLRPGRVVMLDYPVPTSRRGVIDVGPLEIARRDPLALVGAVRRYGESARVWVRPRVHPIAGVPIGLSRSLDGRVDRVPHGSITFAALREYVVGDDLRNVHWRTSARVGNLIVREHVDTSRPRLVILLDDRSLGHEQGGDDESTLEAVCEAAASVLVAAAREDVSAELQLVSAGNAGAQSLQSAAGRADVGSLLDRLAEVNVVPELGIGALRDAVERLRVRRIGDTLLFLTGRQSPDDIGVIASLRGVYPLIIAGILGSVESGLSECEGLLVVGAENGPGFAAAWDGARAW